MTPEDASERIRFITEYHAKCAKNGSCYVPINEDDINALEIAMKALDICEVWDGPHGQIVAPKGTFKKIYEDNDD